MNYIETCLFCIDAGKWRLVAHVCKCFTHWYTFIRIRSDNGVLPRQMAIIKVFHYGFYYYDFWLYVCWLWIDYVFVDCELMMYLSIVNWLCVCLLWATLVPYSLEATSVLLIFVKEEHFYQWFISILQKSINNLWHVSTNKSIPV